MATRKRKKQKRQKQNTIARRITGLVIFINSLFLVLILSAFVFLYLQNSSNTKQEETSLQADTTVNSITNMVSKIKDDASKLATDSDVIAYLEYVNAGNQPIISDTTNPNYSVYSNYILKTQAVINYQPYDLYNLIFVASATNCSSGTDGCAISQNGDLSNPGWNLTDRPWYTELGSNESVLTNPYVDQLTGKYALTYIQKVYANQQLIGYLGIDIYTESLANVLSAENAKFLQAGNEIAVFTNFSSSPTLVYFSKEFTNSYLMVDATQFSSIDNQNGYGTNGMQLLVSSNNATRLVDMNVFGKQYLVSYNPVESLNWNIIVLTDNSQMLTIQSIFGIIILSLVLLATLISLIIGGRVRKLLSPINTILDAIQEIKNGNYEVNIEIRDSSEIKQIGEAVNIMSQEIKNQMQLVYENYAIDSLTGLKNRSATRKEFDQNTFKENRRVAVCLIQVDNLKDINVTKGHMIGDSFIRAIASEIKKLVKHKDMLFSNSHNEFVYVMEDFSSLDSVEYELNKLLVRFRDPLVVNNIKIEVKLYIGVSVYPTDGNTLEELTKKCDMALFNIKETKDKLINFYNEKISQDLSYQVQISEQLSQAIDKEQLYLKYQPLIGKDNNIYGFEALARWNSPSLGEISPQVFITNAEESYLIIPIGTWILREACKAQVELSRYFRKDFVMSVNVSPIQLTQKDFIKTVKDIIKETDIDASYLALEITENVFIKSNVILDDKIDELHDLGVQISLDDFGTGYASLTYLRQMSFDNLKIDKTFVDGIFGDEKEHRIIGTLVSLVHNLGMKVIAEGVETKKQYEYLKQISTDIFQGYIFSKPINYDELTEFIEKYYKAPKSKRNDVLADKNE